MEHQKPEKLIVVILIEDDSRVRLNQSDTIELQDSSTLVMRRNKETVNQSVSSRRVWTDFEHSRKSGKGK